MIIDIPSNYHPMCLQLDIQTDKPEVIYIIAKDLYKPNTFYMRRSTLVKGSKRIDVKLPATPKHLQLAVYNRETGNRPLGSDKSFKVDIREKALPQWNIEVDADTYDFMKFALHFSENASIKTAGTLNDPYVYSSDNGKFNIAYYDRIYDKDTNQYLTTPARIGHKYGVIEVSKEYFMQYTVPMRYVILLHEYSHKYMNPKMGLSIDNEYAADINGMYLYLGTGFSENEGMTAFLTVFDDAKTRMNEKRTHLLTTFVDQWFAGKIVKRK